MAMKISSVQDMVFWSEMIMSLPELDCFPYQHRVDVSGTDVEVLKGVEKLLKLNELSCVRCVRLRTLPDLSALPELFMVDVLGCPLLENISVPDYCGYMAPSVEVPNLGSSGALTEDFMGWYRAASG